MPDSSWVLLPVGPDGARWSTVAPERMVLVVVHGVTALNRLADILSVFESDHRVQLVFTCPGASAIDSGVEHALRREGAKLISWEQASATRFDLAISVHNSGELHRIKAPLVLLSHGLGYTKYARHDGGSVYGLSENWLVRDGAVVPSAIVLSHQEQYERLAELTPGALAVAVVAGDPCYDRIRASLRRRDRYRDALGASVDTSVVAVSSTWGDRSLFGRHPNLIRALLAELPMDEYLVAAVLHPNVWFDPGPKEIRRLLGDCLRAGLRLVPPTEGWQQAIIAADVVIGDNGAVTGYAASIGRPTLLAAFSDHDVVPGTAIWRLGRLVPHLDTGAPLRDQLDRARTDLDPAAMAGVGELASSVPERSAQLLRSTFYRLLDLAEPEREPLLVPFPVDGLAPERQPVAATWVAGELGATGQVRLTRWPADVPGRRTGGPGVHLVVDDDHPRRDLHTTAAILVAHPRPADLDRGLAELLEARPAAVLAVAEQAGRLRVRHRDGGSAWVWLPGRLDPTCAASGIYTLLAEGVAWAALPARLPLVVGGQRAEARIEPAH